VQLAKEVQLVKVVKGENCEDCEGGDHGAELP